MNPIVANPIDFTVAEDAVHYRSMLSIQRHRPSETKYYVKTLELNRSNFTSVAKQILYSRLLNDILNCSLSPPYMIAIQEGKLLQYSIEIINSLDLHELSIASRKTEKNRTNIEKIFLSEIFENKKVSNLSTVITARCLLADMDNTADNLLLTYKGDLQTMAIDMDYMCQDPNSDISTMDWSSAECILNQGILCISTDVRFDMDFDNKGITLRQALIETIKKGIQEGEVGNTIMALSSYNFEERLSSVIDELKRFSSENNIEGASDSLTSISSSFEKQQNKIKQTTAKTEGGIFAGWARLYDRLTKIDNNSQLTIPSPSLNQP